MQLSQWFGELSMRVLWIVFDGPLSVAGRSQRRSRQVGGFHLQTGIRGELTSSWKQYRAQQAAECDEQRIDDVGEHERCECRNERPDEIQRRADELREATTERDERGREEECGHRTRGTCGADPVADEHDGDAHDRDSECRVQQQSIQDEAENLAQHDLSSRS